MVVNLAQAVARRVLPLPVKVALKGRWQSLNRRRMVAEAAKAGMVPPQFMWTMVGAADNFLEQGRDFSAYLIEHGRLPRDGAVLDVGCGLGKYAIHLAEHLKDGGSYEGFDVEEPSVDWCRRAITPRHPHARFLYTPLKSEMYNAEAGAQASAFRFPYDDDRFDLVFLASVFTHMFAEDVDNYIREIARVLKPGGRCIATMYLLDDKRRQGIEAGTACFTFRHQRGDCRLNLLDPPEAAVAYEEAKALEMFTAAGLDLAEPIRYGAWDVHAIQDQDFVIVEKRA